MDISFEMQFGSTPDEIDDLADKVLSGEKIATSSLLDYYRLNLKRMSSVGEHAAVLNSCGKPVATVVITKIDIVQFRDIGESFAKAEGDGNLENWLAIHRPYYSSQLKAIGKDLADDT